MCNQAFMSGGVDIRLCGAYRAKIIFLHVITYNTVALRLYHRCKFQLFATLKNFYSIHSGRQPDPTRTHWDAHLFSKFVLDEYGEHGGVANLDAVSQLKSAWSTCWPFACRYGKASSPYHALSTTSKLSTYITMRDI